MSAHSLLGASGAYRWLNCPGSFHLSQTAPHRASSIYAATGTVAHDYIEKAVGDAVTQGRQPGDLQIDPSEVGKTWSRDGHHVTVEQGFVDGINVMLDYLRGAALLSDWLKVEFKVELDSYFPTPPPVSLFGRVDVGLLSLWDETLEIVDYKNGAGVVVTPVENPQLYFYAAGTLAELPLFDRDAVQRVKLTIVQPHAPGQAVRTWETSVLDVLMWVNEVLVPGVEACAQPDAPYVTGTWCRFCPVSHACPKLHQDAVIMAQQDFNDLLDDPNKAHSKIDTDTLARALDTAERAELWINRLREHALNQLQHQIPVPGWGLVPTRPTRKWLEPDTDIAAKLDHSGVTHDEIWETRLRSPAQVEKQLLRTRAGRRIWDQTVTPLIEARSSGVKLGRTDRPDAKGEFDDDEA